MALLYLLPIILMGFIYLYYCPVHLHKFRQSEGQLLYFRSFFYGIIFFLISIFIQKFLNFFDYYIIFSKVLNGLLVFESKEYFLFYINTLFVSIVLEFIVIIWFYLVVFGGIFLSLLSKTIKQQKIDVANEADEKIYNLVKELWEKTKVNFKTLLLFESLDDELDRILLESVIDEKSLILHMKDRKFYIGFVQFYKTEIKSREELEAIKFVPLRSGYRDKDDLTVKITTEYDENSVYQIVLLKENIISATYYNKQIFDDFIKKKNEKNTNIFKKILKRTPQ